MKRASMAGVFALCLGLTVACGGNKDEADIAERDPKVGDRGDGRPMAITETGCLTAQGDRFVLTALESAAAAGTAKPEPGAAGSQKPGQGAAESRSADAQPTTESYQLIGNEDELRPLVGKQVRVSGEADPPKVAEVRETTPPSAASGATGTAGQAEPAKPGEPQVSTATETRLEVTQLRVQTIAATGAACTAR
jgi:hypothetical protein